MYIVLDVVVSLAVAVAMQQLVVASVVLLVKVGEKRLLVVVVEVFLLCPTSKHFREAYTILELPTEIAERKSVIVVMPFRGVQVPQ